LFLSLLDADVPCIPEPRESKGYPDAIESIIAGGAAIPLKLVELLLNIGGDKRNRLAVDGEAQLSIRGL
jgi:hypothetical protein